MNELRGIDPAAGIGWTQVSVADLQRSINFYRNVLGFQLLVDNGPRAVLGVASADGAALPLVLLDEWPGASRRPVESRGLYHFAVLYPSRKDLAGALARLMEAGWPVQGFADHWVSESVYLADPDGHGIELYADRPKHQWPRREGRLLIGTEPLDVTALLSEAGGLPSSAGGRARPLRSGLPRGTTVGHVHLQVSDLGAAEEFYRRIVGMGLVARYGRSAVFLAAGDYHHHVAANVWAGEGAPPPPDDAAQLLSFSIALPGSGAVASLVDHMRSQGAAPEPGRTPLGEEAVSLRDSDGNLVWFLDRG